MGRRGKTALWGAAVLVLVAGSGAAVYGMSKAQAGPGRPCAGIEVPEAASAKFLNVPELPREAFLDRSASDPRTCTIRPERGRDKGQFDEVDFRVSRSDDSRDLLLGLHRQMSDSWGQTVSPIGNGWRGVLGEDHQGITATVVMLCDGGKDSDLVVNLKATDLSLDEGDVTDGHRARLADLATRTAAAAAGQEGCEAPRGKPVREVAAPFPGTRESTDILAPGAAEGTCAGIRARTQETEADPLAPVEDCLLFDGHDEPAYRIAAYYGPFVQDGHVATYKRGDSGKFRGPAGGSDGLYWAGADCPAQGGTAFFTSETLYTGAGHTPPDPALQRAALKQFAQRSAKAHGCEAPEFAK
ncbi:hypothetical protein [Streptomyces sp. NBC_01304]|uniref:hypothetical protein n=1 Tax=Streptomyces sp. NBC_01304 TaxID=2903818 RepID=UPI002E12E1B3|nr:hypothetical protein OG430_06335 [Streptomyces sp. NBC_01304]